MMPANAAEKIVTGLLGSADAADVEELFRAAERRVSPGFLARRAPGEYARLLGRDDAVVVGARLGGALVGYCGSYRVYDRRYPDVAFLSNVDPAQCVVYHGAGTVIAPDHQGRMLSRRMFLARREELRRRGTRHFIGLIAVGNWLSLGTAVHAGGALIGLANDETALNYVAYAGELAREQLAPADHSIDWTDWEAHKRMFAAGYIVTGLEAAAESPDQRRDDRSRRFMFSRRVASQS